MVPWVGLHGVIVVFPDHTHLLSILNDKCGLLSGLTFRSVWFCFCSRVFTHNLVEKDKLIISGS